MKKFALVLLLALFALTACGPAEQTEYTPTPLVLRSFCGVVDSWEGDMLSLTDRQGSEKVLYAGRAVVCGKYPPEAGCPVQISVAEGGPPDAALNSVPRPSSHLRY